MKLLLSAFAAVALLAAVSSDLPPVDAAAMLKTAKPDLSQRIAQFKRVDMPFNASTLTANERKMIDELVAASRALESMYWRQSDPVGLALYQSLADDGSPLYSFHSRVDGENHGVVAAAELNGALYVLAKGTRRLLRLELSEARKALAA